MNHLFLGLLLAVSLAGCAGKQSASVEDVKTILDAANKEKELSDAELKQVAKAQLRVGEYFYSVIEEKAKARDHDFFFRAVPAGVFDSDPILKSMALTAPNIMSKQAYDFKNVNAEKYQPCEVTLRNAGEYWFSIREGQQFSGFEQEASQQQYQKAVAACKAGIA